MKTTNETPELVEAYLPTKAFSVIDAINRKAAAEGSVSYAMATEHGDYNGHRIHVSWNSYRGYYVCEYQWGQRNVIARGDAAYVVGEAVGEYKRQGRGASLRITLKVEDSHVLQQYVEIGMTRCELGADQPLPFWTPFHEKVNDAFSWQRNGIIPTAVSMLANSKTVEEYESKKEEFLAERRARLARALEPV